MLLEQSICLPFHLSVAGSVWQSVSDGYSTLKIQHQVMHYICMVRGVCANSQTISVAEVPQERVKKREFATKRR